MYFNLIYIEYTVINMTIFINNLLKINSDLTSKDFEVEPY